MSDLIQAFTKKCCKSEIPDLRSGYQVRVFQKIKEGNKERVQVFQGVVIRVSAGTGVGKSFTVRKISDGVGVEKLFPFHSPNVVKVEVQRAHKVRRSKLYFLRDLSGKALRMKEVPLKLRNFVVSGGQDVVLDAEIEKELFEVAAQEDGASEKVVSS